MAYFNVYHWIITITIMVIALGLPVCLLIRIFRGAPVAFCASCGHEGAARFHTHGSIFIELVLWLLLIVPGLIYSLWRLSTRHAVCAECGGVNLVPPSSPVARKLRSELALK